MSQPLSKLQPSALNNIIKEHHPILARDRDSYFSAIKKLIDSTFGKQYTLINSTFKGICLQVLTPEERQRLTLSNENSYTRILDTNEKLNERMNACRVYIPEVHQDRILPNDIYSPSDEDKRKIEFFFPIYMSETEELAAKALKPGDIVSVQIKNNSGGGIYTNVISATNSSLSIFNLNKPSSNNFKCEISRSKKITNLKGAVVSGGQTLVEAEGGKNISEDKLGHQYIKYLYEKEKFFLSDLNTFWTSNKFNASLSKAFEDLNEQDGSNSKKALIWGLINKLCGYKPVGLSIVASAPVVNIDSITNDYGIFKISKEQFDRYILDLERGTDPEEGSVDQEINLSQHSDLLDPDFSIRFFISDFKKHLAQNNSDLAKVSENLSEDNKKIITKYFTANAEKVATIFTPNFNNIIGSYSPTGGSVNSKPKFYDDDDNEVFPNFSDWLNESLGGAAIDVTGFINDTVGKNDNKQTLDQETPQNTPDECHDNYPHYNDYLVYVDTQKKAMRDYIMSPLSGAALEILKNRHKGVKDIVFAGSKIPTPFRVVRFDGSSGFEKDSLRWFDENNAKNLIFNKTYIKGYFRPRNYISKIVCSSVDLTRDNNKYYKNSLNMMYNLNKPMPHFLISSDGQVIQLVDIAIATKSGMQNENNAINISFVEGVGEKFDIIGENNVSINNYILVKTNKNENVFRPHKIGSKASLEAMQKLILFLTNFFQIKYNIAAQPFKLSQADFNSSTIQATGHFKGVAGMNFIYYAWTYGLAYISNGANILSREKGFN